MDLALGFSGQADFDPQAKPAQSVEIYDQKSLEILQRLAQSDPGNTAWQDDLLASYQRVGDVQVAQGKLAGALVSYNAAIAKR